MQSKPHLSPSFLKIVAATSLMISFSDDADEELEEENLMMQSTKIFQI